MSRKEESVFLGKLKASKAIKCEKHGVMHGRLLYHILGIYDNTAVAVKFYGAHKQYWRYGFYDVYQLYLYYKNDWIELRKL